MEQGQTALIAALVAAAISFITNIISTRSTIRIANTNAQKDMKLQSGRLFEERRRSEVALKRQKLQELHIIMSKIALENSQTVSYMHSTAKMDTSIFRNRYLENCERFHKAVAIADIYYPEMSQAIGKVYEQMNIFWGYQEELLKLNIETEMDRWDRTYKHVYDASVEIAEKKSEVQMIIRRQGQTLNNAIETDSD